MKQPKNRRKHYNITIEMISKWFNYRNAHSFNTSSSKKDVLNGIDTLIEHIEEHIIDFLSS